MLLSHVWVSLYSLSLVDTWTVAFSPDSKYIATGSHAGKINLIGVESGKKESALDTRGKFTMSIAYVSHQSFIVFAFKTPLNPQSMQCEHFEQG